MENNEKNILIKIDDKRQEFFKEHSRFPTKLYLTYYELNEFERLKCSYNPEPDKISVALMDKIGEEGITKELVKEIIRSKFSFDTILIDEDECEEFKVE